MLIRKFGVSIGQELISFQFRRRLSRECFLLTYTRFINVMQVWECSKREWIWCARQSGITAPLFREIDSRIAAHVYFTQVLYVGVCSLSWMKGRFTFSTMPWYFVLPSVVLPPTSGSSFVPHPDVRALAFHPRTRFYSSKSPWDTVVRRCNGIQTFLRPT